MGADTHHDTGQFPLLQPELQHQQWTQHNEGMEEAFDFKRYYAYTGHLARKALAEKVARGETVMHAPTGYRNTWTPEGKRTEIDPVLGPLVQEAFRLAANKRSSLRRILAQLTPKGFVSRNGTSGSRSGSRPVDPLCRLSIRMLLLRFFNRLILGDKPASIHHVSKRRQIWPPTACLLWHFIHTNGRWHHDDKLNSHYPFPFRMD